MHVHIHKNEVNSWAVLYKQQSYPVRNIKDHLETSLHGDIIRVHNVVLNNFYCP